MNGGGGFSSGSHGVNDGMGCRPWFWTVNRNREWLSPQDAACGYGPVGMKGRLWNGDGRVMEGEGGRQGGSEGGRRDRGAGWEGRGKSGTVALQKPFLVNSYEQDWLNPPVAPELQT